MPARRVTMILGNTPRVISGPPDKVEFYVQMAILKGFKVVSDSNDEEFFRNVHPADQPLPT